MLDIIIVAVILMGAAVPFCLCCRSLVYAAFAAIPSRAEAQTAAYWGVVLAASIVGCMLLSGLQNDKVSAAYSAALCAISLPIGFVLSRSWRVSEYAETASVLELHALIERYRAEGDSLEVRCSRVVREYDLTRREEEVLVLLLKDCTRIEIAHTLFISLDTVKTHVRNLYRKMGVSGKGELTEVVDATLDAGERARAV